MSGFLDFCNHRGQYLRGNLERILSASGAPRKEGAPEVRSCTPLTSDHRLAPSCPGEAPSARQPPRPQPLLAPYLAPFHRVLPRAASSLLSEPLRASPSLSSPHRAKGSLGRFAARNSLCRARTFCLRRFFSVLLLLLLLPLLFFFFFFFSFFFFFFFCLVSFFFLSSFGSFFCRVFFSPWSSSTSLSPTMLFDFRYDVAATSLLSPLMFDRSIVNVRTRFLFRVMTTTIASR